MPTDTPLPRAGSILQPVSAGILASVVGFASTFAVVLSGYTAMGATADEAASGLLGVSIGMGLLGLVLSWHWRIPIAIAWSTPGSALLIATGAATGAPVGGFPVAVGAFLLAGALITAAGIWKPFGRAVSSIPMPLASAMLAGVLLPLCLAPVKAVAAMPALALPIVLVWALAWRFARLYAVPIAVVVTAALVVWSTPIPDGALASIAPRVVFVAPVFTWDAAIGLALPLFIVTMASQNVPGLAVLSVNGYRPDPGPIFVATGLMSAVIAAVGAHSVNLAAITAALCAGPDAHPDPDRRWIAAATGGATYLLLGLVASFAAAFIAASPPLLIEAVAGLALLGSLGAALSSALSREEDRLPAILTFVTTASGTAHFGIGAAFWGLLAGIALMALARVGSRQ
ncbi:benzoate/H(+) symporter BenE family transporter [Chthonobacter albigriseus]|uniref:benzoate/H(+) symporter BenE family transporter n=1 Tax=Chthonobacter albigriseus TaxID=1683161 RepID=UPI0015EF8549|nr:benzoate/H(+) symporter BenE family transporter [Chthonobacter albigriseus]